MLSVSLEYTFTNTIVGYLGVVMDFFGDVEHVHACGISAGSAGAPEGGVVGVTEV